MDRLEYLLNTYSEVKECDYKGEHYSVRDNGAIMRHPKSNRARPKDNIWTFGIPNENGYSIFCGERVHRIVAVAFIGEPANSQLVVDHIDTNRQNNRPDNLRWVTKLENALNNPLTLRKIQYYCTLEEFISNPAILAQRTQDPNVAWMGAVTAEEARNCLNNLKHLQDLKLIKYDSMTGGIGTWIFNAKFSTWIPTTVAPLKSETQFHGHLIPKSNANQLNVVDLSDTGWDTSIDTSNMDVNFWGKDFLERYGKKEDEPQPEEEYFKTSNKYASNIEVLEQVGEGLVEIVENDMIKSNQAHSLLEKYLNPMLAKGADHIVLGCTHYPFLTDVIKDIVGDRMEIVNPAPAIAKRVAEILAQERLCVSDKGINTFVTTGSNIALVEKMVRDIAPDLANSAIFNTMVI